MQGRDTQNQNSDKRKTYNLARHLHSEYDAMFYIDRDELLYCPPSGENEENTSLNIQANTQREVIDHYISGGYEQLSFQRYAYASRLPPGFNDSLSENVRADLMDNWLPDCLEKGYAARSMSALWKCWGKHYEKQRQFKSGDIRLGKVCPFVGLHEMCLRYVKFSITMVIYWIDIHLLFCVCPILGENPTDVRATNCVKHGNEAH